MKNLSSEKNIFVISTPFQLISTLEAIYNLNLKGYKIYVLYDYSKVNKLQLKKTVDILNIDNIEYFFDSNGNKYFYAYEKIRLIIKLLLQRNKINLIFLGNYTARLYRIIIKFFNHDQIYLLDDGVATLSIQNKFCQNDFYNLYTMFDLPVYQGQEIVTHNFQGLKSFFSQKNVEKTDAVLVLGGKLSEVNIISSEYYTEILRKIKIKFSDKIIYYIPHRGEDYEKLSYIESNLGFIIKKIDYPVELIFLDGTLPTIIISFFSTALISLSEIYTDINICAVRLDYDKIMDRKQAIIHLYDELENYMDVIELT